MFDFLTYSHFRQWLTSHTDMSTIVGLALNSEQCPLHTFIKVQWPDIYQLSVYGNDIKWSEFDGTGKQRCTMQLPAWAYAFVQCIDHDASEDTEISVGYALSALDIVNYYL